jgi:5'-nucleotidase / UDP-sugar diphosphatase
MQKIGRRAFLRRTIALGGGAVLSIYGNRFEIAFGATAQTAYKLRVLHTNDHHARIEPEAGVRIGSTSTGAAITRNFGGVARRKTLIDQLKAGKAADEEIMLVDAGDVFQGTLYFNKFKGAADLEFYNAMGYEAMAVGNHEFDAGQDTLKTFVAGANFPLLSANMTIAASAVLNDVKSPTDLLTGPGKIGSRMLLTKGTKKIGIFGLTPPDTAILTNTGPGITFNTDLKAVAQSQIDLLRAEGADIVIGLTHIGYAADVALVPQLGGLNAIIGGHSHTPLLPQPAPKAVGSSTTEAYPKVVKDKDNKDVIICTDWEWGKWLGDVTLNFDASGALTGATGVIHPVWADGLGATPRALIEGEGAEITPDATIQSRITTFYKPEIVALQNTKVGATTTELVGATALVRTRETNLGNLICDAILERTRIDGAQIAIMNGGGIRAAIPAGDITVGQVLSVLPFGNTLALVTLTGAQLLEALENGVSQINLNPPSTSLGRFSQVAGLRFKYAPQQQARFVDNSTPRDPSKDRPGKRVLEALLVPQPSSPPPTTPPPLPAIKPGDSYRVVVNNFMLGGGDGYSMLTGGTNKVDTGYVLADVVADYVASKSPLTVGLDGRIQMAWSYPLPVVARAQAA